MRYKLEAGDNVLLESLGGLLLSELETRRLSGTNMLVLIAVNTIKASDTKTESADKTSIIVCAFPLFTSCAYSVDASAKTVRGKEYAHHATLNFFIDFLKSAGLETSDRKRNSERKKSILATLSKVPTMAPHAKLAMLGAAMNKKKTGLSIAGRLLLPANL